MLCAIASIPRFPNSFNLAMKNGPEKAHFSLSDTPNVLHDNGLVPEWRVIQAQSVSFPFF
jgi:hypothetical protein